MLRWSVLSIKALLLIVGTALLSLAAPASEFLQLTFKTRTRIISRKVSEMRVGDQDWNRYCFGKARVWACAA
jgi:hypothetical protein